MQRVQQRHVVHRAPHQSQLIVSILSLTKQHSTLPLRIVFIQYIFDLILFLISYVLIVFVIIRIDDNIPHSEAWGVSWHMNGLETPEIVVVRGTEYTFNVKVKRFCFTINFI